MGFNFNGFSQLLLLNEKRVEWKLLRDNMNHSGQKSFAGKSIFME